MSVKKTQRNMKIYADFTTAGMDAITLAGKYSLSRARVYKIIADISAMKGVKMPPKKKFGGVLPTANVPLAVEQAIREIAEKKGISISDVIREAARLYIAIQSKPLETQVEK